MFQDREGSQLCQISLKVSTGFDNIEVTGTHDKSSFGSVVELETKLKCIEKYAEGREIET